MLLSQKNFHPNFLCFSKLSIGTRRRFPPSKYRSSRLEVFCKKGVLKIFAKFRGKHLCQSIFFNKVAGLRTPTFIEHLR